MLPFLSALLAWYISAVAAAGLCAFVLRVCRYVQVFDVLLFLSLQLRSSIVVLVLPLDVAL